MTIERYYQYVDTDNEKFCGRYCGKTPKQAAKKCASQRFRIMSSRGETITKEIEIFIRETTCDSKHKIYGYKIVRIPCYYLVQLHDREVRYRYMIYAYGIPVPDDIQALCDKIINKSHEHLELKLKNELFNDINIEI